MKSIMISITLLLAVAYGIQAQRPHYNKTCAFVKNESRGNIMAEENGEPLDNGRITRYIVYVETASENPPPIKRLMVNGKTFETTATRITENPLNVGVRLNNDAKVCITTAKGRYLWMLDCTNTISNDTLTITLQKKLTKGQIVLLSEVGGEKYYDAISAPIELQPNLYM